jgi:dolichol-phosphate mannosyltransferase
MLTLDPTLLPATGVLPARLPADVAIVIPTFNEAANVPVIVAQLEAALLGHAWEVIFVDDDSPDGTADVVRRIGRLHPHVRCIQRIGRRGLSSAVIEGVLSVNAPYVAVMDADLQHDESLLVPMLRLLESRETDVVIGSRYMEGGSVGDWSRARHAVSRIATVLSDLVVRSKVSDPMSGFFMFRRDRFLDAAHKLSGSGYKILLDLLASAPEPLRVAELPYRFRPRVHGESKLDARVMVEHLGLLLAKTIGRFVPVRALVLSGVLVASIVIHLGLLSGALRWFEFGLAQATASVFGVAASYAIIASFRRRRPEGIAAWADVLSFCASASVGLAGNLSLAGIIYSETQIWWLAGAAGVAISTLWMHMSRSAAAVRRS